MIILSLLVGIILFNFVVMELLCIEAEFEPRGYLDPVFLDDKRVLTNLLVTEGKYTVATTYFNSIQREIHVYMRNTVCSWMLEVSNHGN